MGDDVVDVVRLQAGVLDRERHGAGRGAAFRVGRREVEGVGGHAASGQLRDDACAAATRVLLRLKDDDAAALPEDEALAVQIEGAARLFRLLVALGERANVRHGSDGDGDETRLRRSADRDVRLTGAQNALRIDE
jgi:hypothetical protein